MYTEPFRMSREQSSPKLQVGAALLLPVVSALLFTFTAAGVPVSLSSLSFQSFFALISACFACLSVLSMGSFLEVRLVVMPEGFAKESQLTSCTPRTNLALLPFKH